MLKQTLLFCALFVTILSCKKNVTDESLETNELKVVATAVKKPKKVSKEMSATLEKLYNEKRTQTRRVKTHSIDPQTVESFGDANFDFQNNTYSMSYYDDVTQTDVTTYYVNQTGYNPYNPLNYTVGYLNTSTGLYPVMLRLETTSLETYNLSYYDLDGVYLLTQHVTDGALSGVTPGPSIVVNGFRSWFKNWGDCLIDVYNNHGGASALAILATTVYPPTVFYFAARCGIRNL